MENQASVTRARRIHTSSGYALVPLAAAAISSCSTLSELLPAAVQTVQVAFRLGMCVVRMRDRIEAPSSEFHA